MQTQDDFKRDQLQLKYQAEKIACPKHNSNIISLNIGSNVQLTERLLCQDCQCLGQSVLILNQAENLLYKWYEEEQQSIQDEKLKYDRLTSFFLQSITAIENKFSKFVHELKDKFEKLNQVSQALITKHQQSKINTFIKTLSCTEYLDSRTLQEIAEFFSNQQLIDGQLVIKEKLNFDTPMHLKVKGTFQLVLEHIYNLKNIIGRSQDWEQQYQDFKTELQIKVSNQKIEISEECFHFVNPIQLKGHKEDISAVSISKDNQYFATSDHDGLIILWNAENQFQIRQYQAKRDKKIIDLAFTQNSKLLAASQLRIQNPSDILIYSIQSTSTAPLMRFKQYQSSSLKLLFTNDSQFLISASFNGSLKILDLEQSCAIVTKDLRFIKAISISANSLYIACCCDSGSVILFSSINIRDIKEILNWKPHQSVVTCTQFTEDSSQIVTCGLDKYLKIWKLNSLLQANNKYEPESILLCESGIEKFNLLFHDSAVIIQDQILKFFDLKTKKLIYSLGDQSSIKCYATNSDLKFIILGMERGKLKLYSKPGY